MMTARLAPMLAAFLAGGAFAETVSDGAAEPLPGKAAGVEVLVDGHLAGSGFFASADGLAITAEHVLGKGAAQKVLELTHPTLGRLDAELVAIDAGHDLALLRATLPEDRRASFLPVREGMPPVGARLRLLGAPIYRHRVWIEGTVAGDDPVFEWIGDERRYHEVFYVSAMTPKGMSGGPWIDRGGRVAGLQSGMIVVDGALQGVGFVAPPSAIARLLREQSNSRTPWLGLAVDELWESRERVKEFPEGAEGVVVTVIIESGPASEAGIEQGWLITAAAGDEVRYRDDLLRAARALSPGEELALEVMRPGSEETFRKSITLGCQEDLRK